MIGLTVWSVLNLSHPSWAEDKAVPIHKKKFVDQALEARVVLDRNGQEAVKAWIESASCTWTDVDSFRREKNGRDVRPEIFEMKDPGCSGSNASAQTIPYCAGAATCESRTARFLVRDVYCKASSKTSCPPARDCALATHLTRSMPREYGVLHGKQSGYMGQDWRGWERGKTNRYPWTEANEDEMEQWLKERKAKELERKAKEPNTKDAPLDQNADFSDPEP